MTKSKEVARGIGSQGRSKAYHRKGLWAIKAKNGGKLPVHAKQEKTKAESKAPRFYPAEDVKTPLKRRSIKKAAKLRSTLTPGTIVILLAGRFKGKRAVFLKQLDSGLLLVTGPFKVNGVPLKRVNQAYVIATSTKVSVDGADVSKFDDAYFKPTEKKVKKKGEKEFFEEEETSAKSLPAEYVQNQKAIDESLLKSLDAEVKGYLGSRFSLKAADRPHLMKF